MIAIHLLLALSSPLFAYDPPVPVDVTGRTIQPLAFTRLVLKDEDARTLSVSSDQVGVMVHDHLKAKGFDVQGSENVLFAQDASGGARFQLGGILNGVECRSNKVGTACELVVEWQLFDTRDRRIVYSTVARGYAEELGGSRLGPRAVNLAFDRDVDSLLSRETFVVTLEAREESGTPITDPPDASQLGDGPASPEATAVPQARSRSDDEYKRWNTIMGGMAIGAAGLGVAIGSYAWYLQDPDVGRGMWTGMKLGNAAGWGIAAAGVGLITWGIVRDPPSAEVGAGIQLRMGPGSVQVSF